MIGLLNKFARDDHGAVTVDWTALVAGSILFGIAVVYAIYDQGVAPVSNAASDALSSRPVITPVDLDVTQF